MWMFFKLSWLGINVCQIWWWIFCLRIIVCFCSHFVIDFCSLNKITCCLRCLETGVSIKPLENSTWETHTHGVCEWKKQTDRENERARHSVRERDRERQSAWERKYCRVDLRSKMDDVARAIQALPAVSWLSLIHNHHVISPKPIGFNVTLRCYKSEQLQQAAGAIHPPLAELTHAACLLGRASQPDRAETRWWLCKSSENFGICRPLCTVFQICSQD